MSFKTNNLFILFFLVFVTAATTVKAQLELIVDFTSTISYVNYQCGDSGVFPPCKSLSDAGERARLYINAINTPTIDPSLTIKLRNGATNPIIAGPNNEIGNLFGFCSAQILVDLPSATTTISIDGSTSNGPFISLEQPTISNSNIQCSAGISLTVKYLKLVNWGENEVIFINVDQTYNVATNKAVTLQYVSILNSSKAVIVQPKYSTMDYGAVKVTLNYCTFEDLYSSTSSLLPPFFLRGVILNLSRCTIQNSILTSSEVLFIEYGSLTISFGFAIINVHLDSEYPIFSTLNIGTKVINKFSTTIKLSDSSFSTYMYQRNTIDSPENPAEQVFSFLSFVNCTILSSTFASNSLFFYEQALNNQPLDLKFDDSTNHWEDNTISPGKVLVYLKNIASYKIDYVTANSVASDDFEYLISSQNSVAQLSFSQIASNKPLVGSGTTMLLFDSLINFTQLNLCQSCVVIDKITNTVVFDNTI
ncbi:hypothetical protein DICPUDRAFT_78538 [Dictyostelium purpureum]|uniref:Uncharacterized protein n=1 Tax=Dictyostelium purpureum TaxID=5786 RepID=F0ZJU9_DICPU|nr:uncharacterized protein DICPUDRAFT_78538 [Dictyostelium purpureum]EGC35802.1 hypothetical protein DICPUDRAFT_78538 [Dictyostelium purpureum]|eukprot:XP_003287696.1 hypothetical protein DICPUDRAFT_78538 [Dictyostelium purpureum]